MSLEECTQAIRDNPNDPAAFANRAKCWLAKQDYDNAWVDLREAMRLDPANADHYRDLMCVSQSNPAATREPNSRALRITGPKERAAFQARFEANQSLLHSGKARYA